MNKRREIRSILALGNTASSSRVFNILKITQALRKRHGEEEFKTVFHKAELNDLILVKSRLNNADKDYFSTQRAVGTKLFFPFNKNVLKDGGKFIYYGQDNMSEVFRDHLGIDLTQDPEKHQRDLDVLALLDSMPSLDPFLLKDRFMANEVEVDEAYLRISQVEWQRIREFVLSEFRPLAEIAYGADQLTEHKVRAFADKMWEGTDYEILGPLVEALKLERDQAPEMFFAWKGIIYYKYLFHSSLKKFEAMLQWMGKIKIINTADAEERRELYEMRDTVVRSFLGARQTCAKHLAVYESAYNKIFIEKSSPKEFREFLSDAAEVFTSLGYNISVINHSVHFWDTEFGGDKVILQSDDAAFALSELNNTFS